jgi:hypothetical protein
VIGIGIPPPSLNSSVYCRWNSLCVMILRLQSKSLALILNDILGCYGQSGPSGLHSDMFVFLGRWSWDNPPNKHCTFCRHPIPIQVFIFAKMLQRHQKVSLECSQVTPTEWRLLR